MTLPKRKKLRLDGYDYGRPGSYFVTVCTAGKEKILGTMVGCGVLDAPQVRLSEYGKITAGVTGDLALAYPCLSVDDFVIMPNHVHLLLSIHAAGGPSGTPAPTHPSIPAWISTWKRYINRKIGHPIWQRSYYDHIIRSEEDYREIRQYIKNNPAKWREDTLYVP